MMHHLPLSRTGKGNKKKEKGVDVLFALEAYERALQNQFDVVVLIAAMVTTSPWYASSTPSGPA